MPITKHVELFYFADCPNYQRTRKVVERVAAEEDVPIDLRLVELASADEAELHRFLGSPTVRVDGQDVEPGADERNAFMFACRVYRSDAGLSGQPNEQWVRNALRT